MKIKEVTNFLEQYAPLEYQETYDNCGLIIGDENAEIKGVLITLDCIEQNIDYPWDWSAISLNPNVTIEFVEKHLDKSWSWASLSKHPNMTLDIIVKGMYSWERMMIRFD